MTDLRRRLERLAASGVYRGSEDVWKAATRADGLHAVTPASQAMPLSWMAFAGAFVAVLVVGVVGGIVLDSWGSPAPTLPVVSPPTTVVPDQTTTPSLSEEPCPPGELGEIFTDRTSSTDVVCSGPIAGTWLLTGLVVGGEPFEVPSFADSSGGSVVFVNHGAIHGWFCTRLDIAYRQPTDPTTSITTAGLFTTPAHCGDAIATAIAAAEDAVRVLDRATASSEVSGDSLTVQSGDTTMTFVQHEPPKTIITETLNQEDDLIVIIDHGVELERAPTVSVSCPMWAYPGRDTWRVEIDESGRVRGIHCHRIPD